MCSLLTEIYLYLSESSPVTTSVGREVWAPGRYSPSQSSHNHHHHHHPHVHFSGRASCQREGTESERVSKEDSLSGLWRLAKMSWHPEASPETTSCRWRHGEKCGCPPAAKAAQLMEPNTPSRERASETVKRSDSSVGATSNPLPPPQTEEPVRELTCADFDVDELLAEFSW